jgi:glycosyltransferase involved in cell wall biosynthesis
MAEANACGTPVLAFPRGAAPEVIADGETGYLCADVNEMAAAASRAGEIDAHACRARVEKMFSAQAMTSGYEDVYRKVLGG